MTRLERKLTKRVRRLEAALAAAIYERDRRYRGGQDAVQRARNTISRPLRPSLLNRMAIRLIWSLGRLNPEK